MLKSFVNFVKNSSFLNEMAMRHDVVKKPINIDEDDIEFLQQFPHRLWDRALHKRYEMLFDEVEKLHNKRESAGHSKIKKAVIDAITSGNWSGVSGLLPPEKILRYSKHLSTVSKRMSKDEIAKEADKIAHEHLKETIDDVDDPEESEFELLDNRKRVKILAKPYLNRLYHKLERTKGLDHLPSSNLKGKGRYGYDLAKPLRAPDEKLSNSTDGLKFPTWQQIRDRMEDFLNLQTHRMFGKLPEDTPWKDTGKLDTWSIGYVENEIRKKIESQLRTTNKFSNNSQLEKEAVRLAKQEVLDLARKGELKGPPIPGVAPNGFPIRIEQSKGGEKLVPPPLYLPFITKTFKQKDQNGRVVNTTHEVPIVNPAHFFRELGSEDSDFEKVNVDGKERIKYGDDGKPVYKKLGDKLRGHEGQFVHVDDEEFIHGRHRAAAAISPNHNSEGLQHLTRGDEGYQEAYDKVFNSQRKVLIGKGRKLIPTEGAGFFEDIMRGILQCIGGTMCGGATQHERVIMLQNIEEIHQIIAQTMLQDLRNPKLYEKDSRTMYAKNKTGSYAQRDQMQGGGSRRKRVLDSQGRNTSLDATTSGKDGGEIGIGDAIMSKIADKSKLGGGSESNPLYLGGSTARRFDTSGQNAPYNLGNYRKIIQGLNAEVEQADRDAATAKEVANKEIGASVIDLLQQSINDKTAVTNQMVDILKDLYIKSGSTEADARTSAESQIKSWIEDGITKTADLLGMFRSHPLVAQEIGAPQTAGNFEKSRDEYHAALRKVHADLEEIKDITPQVRSLLSVPPGQQYSQYLTKIIIPTITDNPEVLSKLQHELDTIVAKRSSNTSAASVSPTNPTTGTPVSGTDHVELYKQKKYDQLAVHPGFLKLSSLSNLSNLLNWFKTKSTYSQDVNQKAILSLENAIKNRSGR